MNQKVVPKKRLHCGELKIPGPIQQWSRPSTQAVIKWSCEYFTPERCGVCFEIIDVYYKHGEPKQEMVPHPSRTWRTRLTSM